ncbi:glycogen debranching enzyme GlgX [Opitutaceae bacterium EW11]|nr:glycogen debranching enzyme GlgX [Opitutaceae bacterium EW11]
MDTRIDVYPTHEIAGYPVRAGRPLPFGATLVPGGVNFSIFSRHATACSLVLFEKGATEPLAELPFPAEFRIGDVFCMIVFGLDVEEIEYGYRMDGPFDPARGHRFDKTKILSDPHARLLAGRNVWGAEPDWSAPYPHRARIAFDDFDWQGDRSPGIPLEDLVIYELHVRSFTQHPSSEVKNRGTYAGLAEKIPYLKELGVNCVELMPIFEFDEFENSRVNQETGERLLNYWGYSTVGFFAPKAGFAATGRLGMQMDELKTLVRQLHEAGIEVMLDVVFNHTAEGNENGPYISFRGLDNQAYYILTPEGYYYNFSGCGNTLNCNNPVVRAFVLDCLRYWAAEYHIDGFRFDLASILGRDLQGAPLANPPLLESLAYDPILSKCKLVAEAWDAGGLYQVGSFPAYGRWAEWNGRFRDDIRKFLKGDTGLAGAVATRVLGSADLYGWNQRGPTASINFVTCHDGFTLHDLVAYNGKHNEANGEQNRDGSNDNESWNCGWEGESSDEGVLTLRRRQMKNAIAMLLVSNGVPMLLAGDEFARTQYGNNNNYCHDTELSWIDWNRQKAFPDLHRFVQKMIAFRRAHPVLRPTRHLTGEVSSASGLPQVSFHGTRAWQADFSPQSRVLAYLLDGAQAKGGTVPDATLYIAFNMYWEPLTFELPFPPATTRWHVFANTGCPSPDDIFAPGEEPELPQQDAILVGGRSVLILVAR